MFRRVGTLFHSIVAITQRCVRFTGSIGTHLPVKSVRLRKGYQRSYQRSYLDGEVKRAIIGLGKDLRAERNYYASLLTYFARVYPERYGELVSDVLNVYSSECAERGESYEVPPDLTPKYDH